MYIVHCAREHVPRPALEEAESLNFCRSKGYSASLAARSERASKKVMLRTAYIVYNDDLINAEAIIFRG